ncbi:hypothetical protein T233_01752 [Vagococcus lutrae LBD1]|uniref:DUF985 domain-containing protein n=1 Tax=Vagococcus lutrae LBD1 TaxID=1408226 RepID=V6Q2F4_9ENTE|nr:cupin domain-containing protein [Vagococcus lutrae]EST89304.1 hypothetical protein T233_01752 [Vagococcus lutrae LBD1]
MDVKKWCEALELIPHPEGGFYRQTEKHSQQIEANGKSRALYTSIYFLLTEESPSHFHRLKSDEIWYFHHGESLTVHCLHPDGSYEAIHLGLDIAAGERLHAVVPAGTIFASSVPKDAALVSCLVAPGFDFADFELFTQAELLADYPAYEEIILNYAYEEIPRK